MHPTRTWKKDHVWTAPPFRRVRADFHQRWQGKKLWSGSCSRCRTGSLEFLLAHERKTIFTDQLKTSMAATQNFHSQSSWWHRRRRRPGMISPCPLCQTNWNLGWSKMFNWFKHEWFYYGMRVWGYEGLITPVLVFDLLAAHLELFVRSEVIVHHLRFTLSCPDPISEVVEL